MANRRKLILCYCVFVIVFINYCPGASCGKHTVGPARNFDSVFDACHLKRLLVALDWIGNDYVNKKIVDLLVTRSWAQRQEIMKSYRPISTIEFVEGLKKLDDSYIIDALLSSPTDNYAKVLHDVRLSDERNPTEILHLCDAIIEALCPHEDSDIDDIYQSYTNLYGNEFIYINPTEKFVIDIVYSLCVASRYEAKDINETTAASNARGLIEAGMRNGSVRYLLNQNPEGIRRISREYKNLTGRDVTDALREELTDRSILEYLIINIVHCINSKIEYFVEKLNTTWHTDPSAFIRILITRSEIDLGDIEEAFQKRYGKSLVAFIGMPGIPEYLKPLISPPEPDRNSDLHT